MDIINCRRRRSHPVNVGGSVVIGGDNAIVVQSMASTPTSDVEASLAQIERIVSAGAPLVRLTAQGVREAEAMGQMARLTSVPLVADIHFNPNAAMAAAERVAKVRINPGNFVRPGAKLEDALHPLLDILKKRNAALRIGVNHGSLSPQIVERYGDTPRGMVESALQYLRACRDYGFNSVVVSIKASNTVVMVQTVRLLVREMEREGFDTPLHLGVTEAGDGEDGRIKSAVGIGTLLYQGIGDTIRVSLSEDPEAEVPVARALIAHVAEAMKAPILAVDYAEGFDPISPQRLKSREVGGIGGELPTVIAGLETIAAPVVDLDVADAPTAEIPADAVVRLHSTHSNRVGHIQWGRHQLLRRGIDNPVIASLSYDPSDPNLSLKAAADFGTLLLNGLQDAIEIEAGDTDTTQLALGILQAARIRFSKTEYISCPSCGRTMFDLQQTLRRVKEATSHLKGLKIGVMGCIVNGPGEMADADYGYVGAAASRISLYRRKECVEKNIPQEEAIERLVNLIKSDGKWTEPSC